MSKKNFFKLINNAVLLITLLLVAGCADPVTMPKVVDLKDHSASKTGSVSNHHIWTPEYVRERKWTSIIIHHSATETGNADVFDKLHREVNHWDGVGYHFVIGNGTDSFNGQIEPTFRWNRQREGAHCGGTTDNWANEKGIGICLVGNFNHSYPTPQQLSSLKKLVKFLQKRYNIPDSNIFGHRTTPEARPTDCPGHNFNLRAFINSLH